MNRNPIPFLMVERLRVISEILTDLDAQREPLTDEQAAAIQAAAIHVKFAHEYMLRAEAKA